MKLLPTLRRNTFGRHARHDFGAARPSAYDLRARVFAERDNVAVDVGYRAAVARQTAVFAATQAPTLTLPVVIDAEVVEDPELTMPLRHFVIERVDPHITGSLALVRTGYIGGAL